MVDVRFEFTTDDAWSVDDAICEGIINWATGKRLSNRLPKLSVITLAPKMRRQQSQTINEIKY